MLLCSSDKTGCKKLNIDETCLPDACRIFCVDTVNTISTAKCNINAGSEQFSSFSKRPCLWQRIKVRSFFLSTFFRIILQACSAVSATLRKSSIDEPATLLFNAANGSLYSVAVNRKFIRKRTRKYYRAAAAMVPQSWVIFTRCSGVNAVSAKWIFDSVAAYKHRSLQISLPRLFSKYLISWECWAGGSN